MSKLGSTYKPTILLFTANEGHYSLAQAVKEQLESNFNIVEVLEPIVMAREYVTMYRWFPYLFKIPYLLSKQSFILKMGVAGSNLQKKAEFEKLIHQYQPIACISTYFMWTQTLAALKKNYKFELLNIVANPRTIHPVEINDQSMNFVFDDKASSIAKEISELALTKATGWLVRNEFKSVSKSKIKAELGLNPDLLTFTIVAGSEGNHKSISILPYLVKIGLPLQVLVMCGKSKLIYNLAKSSASHAENSPVKIIPLGFTNDLAKYLQAADLVIGKAGPNTLFEAVATNSPFFAITHISGQEDGNLEIIREYHLGYVEENIKVAAKILERIVKNPDELKTFQISLQQMSNQNEESKNELFLFINKLV